MTKKWAVALVCTLSIVALSIILFFALRNNLGSNEKYEINQTAIESLSGASCSDELAAELNNSVTDSLDESDTTRRSAYEIVGNCYSYRNDPENTIRFYEKAIEEYKKFNRNVDIERMTLAVEAIKQFSSNASAVPDAEITGQDPDNPTMGGE